MQKHMLIFYEKWFQNGLQDQCSEFCLKLFDGTKKDVKRALRSSHFGRLFLMMFVPKIGFVSIFVVARFFVHRFWEVPAPI